MGNSGSQCPKLNGGGESGNTSWSTMLLSRGLWNGKGTEVRRESLCAAKEESLETGKEQKTFTECTWLKQICHTQETDKER